MLDAVFVSHPALSCKLYELTVYVLGRAAALFPIENEFRSYAFVKRDGDFCTIQNLLGISAGLPLIIEFRRRFDIKSWVLLAVTPLG